MTQLLNLLIKVLLYPKCLTEAANFLLHLVGHTYRYKVALVFLGIVHANIVITSLLLGSAVRVEAAGSGLDDAVSVVYHFVAKPGKLSARYIFTTAFYILTTFNFNIGWREN